MKKICFCVPYPDHFLTECILQRLRDHLDDAARAEVWYVDGSNAEYLREQCEKIGAKVCRLSGTQLSDTLSIKNRPFLISWAFFNLFQDRNFSEIHFADLGGAGYHCLQAKRTMSAFSDTILTVEMLGPSQFCNELSENWGYGGFEQLMVQYMERYCCEHCDQLIAPDSGIVKWVEDRRWARPKNVEVCPLGSFADALPPQMSAAESAPLCFVGPLGKSGGLHLFTEALVRMENSISQRRKVFFVGEYQMIDDKPADAYIFGHLNSEKYDIEILGALDPHAVVRHVSDTHALPVFCGKGVNGPELLMLYFSGIDLLVADTPSRRDLFESETLFSNEHAGHLVKAIQNGKVADRKSVSIPKAERVALPKDPGEKSQNLPLVSIVTAFYNHADYLDMVRESVEKQTYPNIEWIVVDDGSTKPEAVALLQEYEERYKDRPWRIVRQENAGPSVARNSGAAVSKGEYLVFLDSDNVAKPNMVEDFVRAMQRSGCDCLSCYFDVFLGKGRVNKTSLTGETYAVLGPSLETGAFMNCFGDTNVIVRKKVFDEIGGFIPKRVITEDWMILTRLALKGYQLDVIPQALFWYRVLPESNVGFGSEYDKQQMILRAYGDTLPPYVYHILNSLCRPSFIVRALQSESEYTMFFHLADRMFPKGSKRRRFIKKLCHRWTDKR